MANLHTNADTPPPTSAPILTVHWDTVIGARHAGYDPDTGPIAEPVDLGDLVVAHIASTLIAEIRHDIRKEVRTAIQPAISAEITAIVREELSNKIRKTNTWGEAQGDPLSLRDLIMTEVQAYLNEPIKSQRYDDRARPGGFRELLAKEVDNALTTELRGVITEARTAVAAKVRDSAAEMLGSIVKAQR